MRGKPVGPALLEGAAWWVLAVLLWGATVDPLDGTEIALAAACAVPCALAARAGRRAVDARWKVRARWLRWLVVLPTVVVADTARLAARLVRGRLDGRETLVALRPEPDPVVDTTRRALAAAAVAAAPGSVVLDVLAEPDCLRLHEMAAGRPRLDAEALR